MDTKTLDLIDGLREARALLERLDKTHGDHALQGAWSIIDLRLRRLEEARNEPVKETD